MLIGNVHAYYTYKAGKDQAGKSNLELWNTESAEKVAELIQKKQRGWCVCILYMCVIWVRCQVPSVDRRRESVYQERH